MSLQNNAGTIVIDAVLTDTGRKKMAQGNFNITHFGLGDDEVDYTLGNSNNGTFELDVNPPILEAFAEQNANIQHGLLDLPRQDLLYLPTIKVNNKVDNAVLKHNNYYHLAVNKNTTRKAQSSIGQAKVLENQNLNSNVLLIETGIEQNSTMTIPTGSVSNQARFITNTGLMDKQFFVYCDSRFFDYVYINNPTAYYKNDAKGNLYTNIQPLQRVEKSSLGVVAEYYQSFICTSVVNAVYNKGNSRDFSLSMYKNIRGSVLALNFGLTPKVVNPEKNNPDDRFTVFGQINQSILPGSNNYDYIDTNILIEGASTGRQLVVPIRIIRYTTT